MDIYKKTKTLLLWHIIYAMMGICTFAASPSDIILSDSLIYEYDSIGTLVGILSTNDPDPLDNFTYELVTGEGDDNNSYFLIIDDQLVIDTIIDYDNDSICSVRIRSTDSGAGFYEKDFTIYIVDTNQPPTDIALSPSSVDEGQPIGTSVGTLSTTDADTSDSFTYTLVAGTGGADNSSFTIVGNTLRTNAVFNFDTKSSYSVRIRTTDSGTKIYEKAFTISILNVSQTPTDIALTPSSVDEGQPIGTAVGTLSTTDPDAGDSFTYTLVAGAGATDNSSFTIDGNTLKTNAIFDFDTKSSYSVRVRTTDSGTKFYEKAFTITIINIAQTPTDIALTPSSIDEGQPIGTAVGTLSTTDPDAGDSFTYTLVAGTGDTDNSSFTIVGNTLRTNAVFNFDTKSSYTVRVRTTDSGTKFYEKAFTISILNISQTPTDIALTPSSVDEGQPIGTPVGTLSTTDPDAGDSFTYTLVAGAGATDNSSFAIDGSTLKTNAIFNFNTKSSYSVRVRTTDSGTKFYEKAFTISILNISQTPTDIALTPSSVDEGQPVGTSVGTLSTTDPDAGDSFTYTLVAGTGATDNSSFTIIGNTLRTNAVFNFDTKSSYSVRIRTTDSGTKFYEKAFTITIVNIAQTPTDITLTPSSVDEGQPIGTIVGILSTTDPDAGDSFTYILTSGAGSHDNNRFAIVGNTLRTNAVFNFDTKSSYTVRIRTTDSGTKFYEKAFTITIVDTNQPPADITLTPSAVNEGQPIGTTVGALLTTDPDTGDSFTYLLVAGAGATNNSRFTIDGDTLRTNAIFDFDTKSSYSVRIRSTDSGTLYYEKIFTITVININQKPTEITLTPSAVNEGQPIGTSVGSLVTTDPDTGDSFTYLLVAGAGATDNNSFTIFGNSLRTNAVFDFDSKSSYSVRIRSTDAGTLSYEKIFIITVININQKPTEITLTPSAVNEGQPIGTLVGTLVTTDPDTSDSFSYLLVTGAGATDNNSFIIVGNSLRTNVVFDFDTKASYSVRIRSTDAGTLYYEKILTITIVNVNHPPTDIHLTPSNINENQPVGTLIGTFSSTDIDLSDIYTYTLVAGEGDADNNSFNIVSNGLRTKVIFNYELKHSCSIRVKTTDEGAASFEKIFTITINDLNEMPSNILLTPNIIKENKPVNTLIGLLSTVDPDSGQTFTYSFTPGTGSTDNQKFIITGNELRSNEVFNYEIKSVCYIRIKTTNGLIESLEKALVVTVLDSSEAPVISGIETSPLIFNEDDLSKAVSSSLLLNDDDSPNMHGANIQITENYLNTEDSLFYSPVSGISVSYTNKGFLKATGNASLASYQNFLRGIRYKNFNSFNPDERQRTVSFIANDGINLSLPAYRYIQVKRINDPPLASNLRITSRDTIIGELHTAQFLYTDPDEDPQGKSTFNWYRATSNTGLNKEILNGAITNTYNVTYYEGGKYISFAVTPVDSIGLSGTTVNSRWYYINSAPDFIDSTIKNVVHPGVIAVGETITANFPYYDYENDAAGEHEYQWYVSSNRSWSSASPITSQNDETFTISSFYNNKYIAVKARPYAISGSLIGKEYKTNWYAVSKLPTATLSGNDSICKGGAFASLNVILTGSSPWSLTYKVNNSIPFIIRDIYSDDGNYQLSVSDTGTYTLVAVSDSKNPLGKVDGIGSVYFLPSPKAQLTQEILSICSYDTSTFNIPITLSGVAPWEVIYTVDEMNPKTINFDTPTGALIKVNYKTKGLYRITKVTDTKCESPGSGQTNVIEKLSPKAVLSGDTTVCASQNAMLNVSLSGNGPWTLFYTKDNGPVNSIFVNQNINTFNYSMPVNKIGIYRLTGVKDEEQTGCAFGSASVKNFILPTASVTSNLKVCEGSVGTLNVNLSGTPPWYISYDINSSDTTYTSAIWQSPYPIPAYKPGVYKIYSIIDANCQSATSKTSSVSIIQPPEVSISITDTVFPVDLIYTPIFFYPKNGSYTQSDKPSAFIINDGDSLCFSPVIAGIGPSMIRYQYTDNVTKCIGKDSIQITVIGPDGSIHLKDKALDTLTLNPLNKLCFNYDPILIEGHKQGSDTGVFTISGVLGSPPALVDNKNNTAYIYPSVIQNGKRTVTFSYKVGPATQKITRDFTFEKIGADFMWDNDCFSGTTMVNFSDISQKEAGSTLDHHLWNFHFPTTIKKFDAEKIGIYFYSRSTYPIEYTIVSQNGCSDTKKKDFVFLPTYNPKANDYYEDFSDGASYWKSNPIDGFSVNTWELGKPEGETFDAAPAGTTAWYTKVGNVNEAEYSYVTSPCFNFWGSERPMIKMNIWRAFSGAPEIDGAVLQYSTDNGQSWNIIGEVEDGINWYNSQSIEGAPGLQKFGWTGTAGKQDTSWVECKHALDMLIGKTRVKLRIAYGAPSRNFERDGFAFDDIWIGERKKRVVMEHFTNAGSEACKNANSTLNQIVNKNAKDIIDLQYHMDVPGADPFYILNPVPAYSRSYYYDLPDVPYSIMNGGVSSSNRFDFDDNTPEEKDIKLSVLKDNKFYVKGHAIYAGDVLAIGVDIKALEPISQRPITVYVAIVENEIKGITGDNGETIFESVVHDLIPCKTFNNNWEVGPTEHIDLDWDIENIFDLKELRVITYIQNEITQEIYQASIDNPNTETGIKENFNTTGRNFLIYPNPTLGRASIQWKNPLEKDSHMEITDNLGRVVWQGTMSAGEQVKIISLEGLDAGTYTFRTILNDKTFESQKIILLSNR